MKHSCYTCGEQATWGTTDGEGYSNVKYFPGPYISCLCEAHMRERSQQLTDQRIEAARAQHFRVSANVSADFVPNGELIGEFLVRKGKLMIKLGEELNRTDPCDLRMEAEKLGICGVEGLEITGSY